MERSEIKLSLPQLLEELNKQAKELEQREVDESIARNATTDCINRINRTQKAIDVLMKEIKDGASHRTDWAKRQGVPVRITA